MRKLLCLIIYVGVMLLFIPSCTKDEPAEIFPTDEDVILKDISYGSHERQKMDVYLPAGRNKQTTKMVIFIHGGGWIGGSKDDLPIDTSNIHVLKEQFPGFALITLNYRLVTGSENRFPAAEEDIVRAMSHIYSNLESYQLASETYMSGGSAGAHLAALYTLKHNPNGRIKGCIGVSGAYNLTSLYQTGNAEAKAVLEAFLGGTPQQQPEAYAQASPVNFVTSQAPKFLILHGKEDLLTPIGQANELAAALNAQGIEYTRFTYSGGHGIPGEHLAEAFAYINDFLR